ncbi:hypothetical protein GOODEAATRI_005269 [Goodea atripinnis]|uniref:Uncharacterized protein n=1 Tax=Goodea atripinnis TaxID=208336 RepID=A0ABV0N840_9TELE
MESKAVSKDRFFIVIRGKSRKGFCRGCIGRVEAETAGGELMGLLYGCGSNAGSPKSGGLVKAVDTYALTRHQAQLLLYVSSTSKRLELLSNPQLFSTICELSAGDLVVTKHKKGHVPGVVKNLMQIGKKENKEDLKMIGFQVEFMVSLFCLFICKIDDNENDFLANKLAPLTILNAADIIQVVKSYAAPLGLQYRDVKSGEVGSLVEVVNNAGITVYGVIQWLGIPQGKMDMFAGIELILRSSFQCYFRRCSASSLCSSSVTEHLCLQRSEEGTSQGAYTLQIFLEKEQMGQTPTVQKLLDTSCMSGNIKFETMPPCLIVQMPRCGSNYKMFSHIIPSIELDITDLLYNCRSSLTGDDQNGYNIPEVRACPELGDFLGQPDEELTRANPALAPELVRRLLCDSYMFLYHSPEMLVSEPNSGGP